MKKQLPLFGVCALLALSSLVAQERPPLSAGTTSNAYDEAVPGLRDAAVVALAHVRVIDGRGTAASEDQTLVVEGGRIRAVGDAGSIVIPAGATVVDLGGHSVLPGLVMLHEHLAYTPRQDVVLGRGLDVGVTHAQPVTFPRLFLAYGVTTLRTAGTDHPYMDLNLKNRIDAGKSPGPEIHLTSPFLSGSGDPFIGTAMITDTESARRTVRFWAANGFTSFKAYQWLPEDALAAVIDEAHRLGHPVTAHLGREGVSCRRAAELGIDNLEHGLYPCVQADDLEPGLDGPKTEALMRTLLDRGVVLTLTFDRRLEPLSERALRLLDPSARDRYLTVLATRPQRPPASMESGLSPHSRPILEFVRAGGRIVLGSDAGCCGGGNQIAGLASHAPLLGLVETGFSPLDAIRIGTLEGARFLGIGDRTGSIEVGKEADLLIVEGNPDEHIEDLEDIRLVMENGVPFDPESLMESIAGQVGWH